MHILENMQVRTVKLNIHMDNEFLYYINEKPAHCFFSLSSFVHFLSFPISHIKFHIVRMLKICITDSSYAVQTW